MTCPYSSSSLPSALIFSTLGSSALVLRAFLGLAISAMYSRTQDLDSLSLLVNRFCHFALLGFNRRLAIIVGGSSIIIILASSTLFNRLQILLFSNTKGLGSTLCTLVSCRNIDFAPINLLKRIFIRGGVKQ